MEYEGACRHAHGHNGKVEIVFQAKELDDRAMVRDFTDIRIEIENWLNKTMDHRMLLRKDDPMVAPLQALGEPIYMMDVNPTAEAIAEAIFKGLTAVGIPVAEVRLWETDQSLAIFTPDP
jgi:6-pyruvoyltetrahydropterin/6-carboxytetrahydropterin synthase